MPAVTVTMIILGSLAAIILTTVYFSGENVLILCARNNVVMCRLLFLKLNKTLPRILVNFISFYLYLGQYIFPTVATPVIVVP